MNRKVDPVVDEVAQINTVGFLRNRKSLKVFNVAVEVEQ